VNKSGRATTREQRPIVTQERFKKIIDQPDLLSAISYEELKTLTLAYPYAQNLRYLLALKARQTGHPEYARTIAAAAAYSLDRRRLYGLFHTQAVAQPLSVLGALHEEILELRPIESVQRELELLVRQMPSEETPAALELRPITPTSAPAVPPAATEIVLTVPELVSPPPPPIRPFGEWNAQFNLPLLQRLPKRPAATKPVIKESAKATSPVDNATPPSPPAAKSRVGSEAQTLAERSLQEKKEVMSETLASLYAAQGRSDKAIAMYERLSLVFPEKSAYFAALIAKLKK
jgi:hypothetical protein